MIVFHKPATNNQHRQNPLYIKQIQNKSHFVFLVHNMMKHPEFKGLRYIILID